MLNIPKRIEEVLRSSPRLESWRTLHPRSTAFLLKLATRAGLQLTAGVLVAALCWFAFFGVIQDLLANDPLVRADLRIMAFLQTLRAPEFNQVMVLFTDLANWQIVIAGAVILALFMYRYRQWWWLAALALCLAGEQLLSHVLKWLFARDRPDLHNALIPAAGGSFPSGHVLAGSIFYGFVACYIASQTRSWSVRIAIVAGAVLLVVGIGFSRVYLGVHWPSDVIGSFALGPAWVATVLIVLSAGWIPQPGHQPKPVPTWHLWAGFGIWLLVVAGYYVLTDPIVTPVSPKLATVALGSQEFDARLFDNVPRFTEDITGAAIEPINAVFIGSEADLVQALAASGWIKAVPLGIGSGLRLLWAELRNQPDPNAPGVPAFLSSVPNEMTFERPTALNSARERHHLHVWSTSLTKDGKPVWVGTVHQDVSGTLYRGLTYHKIDPDVDSERAQLRDTLQASACLSRQHAISVTAPMKGQNILHNTFFTDGMALEFELQCK